VLFAPDWGDYDLTVGARIESVYGGVADREKLQLFKPTPRTDTLKVTADETLMQAYAEVQTLMDGGKPIEASDLSADLRNVMDAHPREWLLRAELLDNADSKLREQLVAQLDAAARDRPELAPLVKMALT
jgi:phenylalanine-4-hydroxylase